MALDSSAGGNVPALGTTTESVDHAPGAELGAWGWHEARFQLLRVAQWLRYSKEKGLDQDRVCWCHRTVTDKYGRLPVKRQKDGAGARVGGLMQCGSVWVCPPCAAKICALRAAELSLAMVRALAIGLHAYLLTLTFPHSAGDQIAELLVRQAKALRTFKGSKGYRAWKQRHKRAGSVRSLEITWGQNGFHPHTHDLTFAAPGMLADRAGIRALKRVWLRACLKQGLLKSDGTLKPFRDFWKHALDLRGGDRAAEYVAKYGRDERWGLSSELAAPHAKIGIVKAMWFDAQHFTPFQLLEWARNGDRLARRAFNEFADAIDGKRMLSWSPGLKKLLGISDLDDSELLEQPLSEEEDIGAITAQQYAVIVARNAYVEFRRFVSECCTDVACAQSDMDAWIAWLERERLPTWSAKLRWRSGLSERPDRWATPDYMPVNEGEK